MPKRYETAKDAYVGIRIPKDLVEQLDKIAEIEVRSRSNLIEVLIRKCLPSYLRDSKLT